MIKFKINGSDIQIPTTWDDLTFAQYLQILETKDLTDTVCMLTGLDRETLEKSTITGLESIIQAASFLQTKYEFQTYYPQIGPHKLPANKAGQFDIRLESVGQFEDMRAVIIETKGDLIKHTKAYGRYVAIYLQKIIDGEYKNSRVPEIEKEVQTYKAHEVLAAGQFFFLKQLALLTGTQTTSPPTNQSQKKSKLVSKTSKRNSARTR